MQVSHELSVPAVSTMLLSVLAWGAAAASSVLLWEALSQRTWTLPARAGCCGHALRCCGGECASVAA